MISGREGKYDLTMEVLRLCISETPKSSEADRYTRERLQEIYEFFADVEALYNDIRQLPLSTLRGAVKARGAVRKLLSRKSAR